MFWYNYNGLEVWCKIVCYSSWICLSVPIMITCSVKPQRSKTLESGMVVSPPDHIFSPAEKMGLVSCLFHFRSSVLECWCVVLCYLMIICHQRLHSTMRTNDLLAKCPLIRDCQITHTISYIINNWVINHQITFLLNYFLVWPMRPSHQ